MAVIKSLTIALSFAAPAIGKAIFLSAGRADN